MENITHHQKKTIALRHFFLGKSWHKALAAMELAQEFHTGKRKDGVTPEFEHQLGIASYLLTMEKNLVFPELTIAVSFLHDVSEDYNLGFEELEKRFGNEVSAAVKLLTKKYRGNKIPTETYFSELVNCPIASVIKGADRINNQQTIFVFKPEKQKEYLEETQKLIVSMLKLARHKFTEQFQVYHNILFILRGQMEFIQKLIEKEEQK
jgi:(p)ppGpp synthase/HD superfamily hydrolase